MTPSVRALNWWLAIASLTVLTSCAVPSVEAPVREASEPLQAQAGAYRLDPAASTLHILVYRGGPMARLGHNHVISSPNLRGNIWRGASLQDSGFDITVPVAELVVDDSVARATEGPDFEALVSAEAKDGTKANMLRDSVLDAARYPDIHIRSVALQGNAQAPTVTAAIRIKDQTRQVSLPVTLSVTATGLRVTGAFELRQTDFGITPLSVGLGALKVLDTLRIRFELVATAP